MITGKANESLCKPSYCLVFSVRPRARPSVCDSQTSRPVTLNRELPGTMVSGGGFRFYGPYFREKSPARKCEIPQYNAEPGRPRLNVSACQHPLLLPPPPHAPLPTLPPPPPNPPPPALVTVSLLEGMVKSSCLCVRLCLCVCQYVCLCV